MSQASPLDPKSVASSGQTQSGQTQLAVVESAPPTTTMRHYLDRAIGVLQRFGLTTAGDSGEELIRLLEEAMKKEQAEQKRSAGTSTK